MENTDVIEMLIEPAAKDLGEFTGSFGTCNWAPAGAPVYNPAFDVTPANLIAGIITEKGVIKPHFLNN